MKLISERIMSEIMKASESRGLNQYQLAKLLDCSPAFITQLKNGSRKPSLDFLDKVEKKLKVNFCFWVETLGDKKYNKEIQKEIDALLEKELEKLVPTGTLKVRK